MDSFFLLTILFIFLSAVISVIIKLRMKDCCLKDFHRFNVQVEEKNGNNTWGVMNAYPTGFELNYLKPLEYKDGHQETSYLLYKDQFYNIQAIYRYPATLSERNKKKRAKDIERSYHPNLFRRSLRAIRNLINNFKDAIIQAVSSTIVQLQRAKPNATFLRTQDKRLTDISAEFVTVAANAYEPMLERHIGNYIVLEVIKDQREIEYYGILKEYSSEFIELLDIEDESEHIVNVGKISQDLYEKYRLKIQHLDRKIIIQNDGEITGRCKRLKSNDYEINLDLTLNPNSTVEIPVDLPNKDDVSIELNLKQRIDMIVPRKHAIIRHGGEVKRKLFKFDDVRT